jgi:hypothetical protein
MGCASSGHITKLKQSIFAFRYLCTICCNSPADKLYGFFNNIYKILVAVAIIQWLILVSLALLG